jgi:hypothetical protein
MKLGFEAIILFGRGRDDDDIIDMNCEDGDPGRCLTAIYAPFARQAMEPKTDDGLVESLVPYTASLLHTVDALQQSYHPIFLTRRFETGRLFHEHRLGFRKYAVKEGGFDVNVLNIPVEDCSDVEKHVE